MNKAGTSAKMVTRKSKNKVPSCSTPERNADSPSRDSDSLSEAASPVPFLCTQDGTEGETDVVWNYYTPKSGNAATSRIKNSTPLSSKVKKTVKTKILERPLIKRRSLRTVQKKNELFKELIELNQNVHKLIEKKSKDNYVPDKQPSGSEEDIFSDSPDNSPKNSRRSSTRCLRKNLLSSKFSKPDTETAMDSDDSINECLLKASQVVEENILKYEQIPAKRTCNSSIDAKKFKMHQDSTDELLSNIKFDSPIVNNSKNHDSPCLNNDSFDSFVGNLNDSALERLTQMPVKSVTPHRKRSDSKEKTNWMVKELVVHNTSPSSKSLFGRHSSMPESPTVTNADTTKPSTSGMVFGRYNSMPYFDKNAAIITAPEDSPIRCTPDEIKRKHQQAREKLLAKRLLPFTTSQLHHSKSLPAQPTQVTTSKKTQFQPKFPSTGNNKMQNIQHANQNNGVKPNVNAITNPTDIKLLIEKKRQEALMRLRRRQPQNKLP